MWAVYAIIASFWTCAYSFGNQIAKVSPNIFMVYRGVVPILLLLPFIGIIDFIDVWQFYAVCVFQGGLIAYIDYRNFRAMRVWGAEIISSIHPFNIGLVFVMWLIFHPYAIVEYIENPIRFLLIVLALSGVVFAVSGYKKSRKSCKALIYMLPYIVVSTMCDFFNKTAMSFVGNKELIYGSYLYILITAVVVAVINLTIYFRSHGTLKNLIAPHNSKYTFVLVVLVLSMVFKNFAMFNADNPSYVSATIYTYVIWIMLIGVALRHMGYAKHYKSLEKNKVILLLISVSILILCGK